MQARIPRTKEHSRIAGNLRLTIKRRQHMVASRNKPQALARSSLHRKIEPHTAEHASVKIHIGYREAREATGIQDRREMRKETKKRTTTTKKKKLRAGAASRVNVEEEEASRGLTTLGRPRVGLMIEERSRLNDPCPRVLGSPWIGPRFAVESKGPPRYRLPKTPAVGVSTSIFMFVKIQKRA